MSDNFWTGYAVLVIGATVLYLAACIVVLVAWAIGQGRNGERR